MTDQEYKELYESGLTIREIAKLAGNVTSSTVRLHLIKNNVRLRDRWESNKGMFKKGREAENKIKLTEEQEKLITTMFYEYKSIEGISESLGNIMSRSALSRRINAMGLKRDNNKMMSRVKRDRSLDSSIIEDYKNGDSISVVAKKFKTSRETVNRILTENNVKKRSNSETQCLIRGKEYPKTLENYEELFDMYVTRKMTKRDIGLQLNVDPGTVDRALKLFNIPVRGVKETVNSRVFFGPESSNWKGGRTSIYLRLRSLFSNHLVKDTLDRDEHTCQCCGSHEHLEVHHIKPFKEIFNEILEENNITSDNLLENEEELFMKMKDDPRFLDPDNLITYCRDCHLFKIHGYKRNRTLNFENTEEEYD